MALTFGMIKGEDFFVDDTRVVVHEIKDDTHYSLKVMTDPPKIVDITDEHATEILPKVRVSSGNTAREGTIRVVIEAPFHIKIFRGRLYRTGANVSSKIHENGDRQRGAANGGGRP